MEHKIEIRLSGAIQAVEKCKIEGKTVSLSKEGEVWTLDLPNQSVAGPMDAYIKVRGPANGKWTPSLKVDGKEKLGKARTISGGTDYVSVRINL